MSGSSIAIDVSGLGVRVDGASPALREILEDAWAGFVVADAPDPILAVTLAEGGSRLTPGKAMVGPTRVERDGNIVRLTRDEGEASLDLDSGRASVALAAGDERRRAWGLVNLVGAALAWRLAARGGGILHAAGVVIDGRAFVLLGAEGAGKTTFARVAASSGLDVLSDDQVVVASSGGRLEALAAPVRNREFPRLSPGRWPVAAFLLPRHGAAPALTPATRLELSARLAASLLYVGTEATGAIEALASGAPGQWLTFAPEPSFLRLLGAEE